MTIGLFMWTFDGVCNAIGLAFWLAIVIGALLYVGISTAVMKLRARFKKRHRAEPIN